MAIYHSLNQFYRSHHSNKVKRICQPLDTHFGLDVFAYSHEKQDGGYYQVSNVPYEALLPWENETYKDNFFLKDPSIYEPGIYLLNVIGDSKYKSILTFMSKKGVNLHIRIVRKDKTGCHQFLFGSKRRELPFDALFFSETNVFNSFCDYFLEESVPLLKRCDSYTFSLPELMGKDYKSVGRYTPANVAIAARDRFLAEISPDYERMLQLSKQEKKCLSELLKGKSAAGIGLNLNLSSRTVESYLTNIKNKMDCYSKEELINKLIKFQNYLNP
jgi:DNA-binding CsgD family transcriptional regulator